MMAIGSIGGIGGYEAVRAATAPAAAGAATEQGAETFTEKLGSAIEAVDGSQRHADDALAALASGEQVDIHGSMIALEEADIELRAMVSVRDKALRAYETIMNMSV